eukprot:GHVU01221428.1.p1 GENE.GHVU01221428.1~~GHVU01221428.1.p1  ORF type:complete len:101 (-),score=1.10 GHVU01221428.1:108-410(-)
MAMPLRARIGIVLPERSCSTTLGRCLRQVLQALLSINPSTHLFTTYSLAYYLLLLPIITPHLGVRLSTISTTKQRAACFGASLTALQLTHSLTHSLTSPE